MSQRHAYITLPLLILSLAAAAAKPPDEETLARYAAAARNERDLARTYKDQDAALAGDYHRFGPLIKRDLLDLKAATDGLAAVHEQIAVAYEKADVEEVRRLREGGPQEQAQRARTVIRERITEWRQKQFTASPSEQWYQDYHRYWRSGMAELNAWAEARKAAADAWGRVADACVPGHDPDQLDALKEAAYALDVEREVAEMRFTWVRERALLTQNQNPKYPPDSPELTRRLDELLKVQEQRLALKRREIDREREERQLDRQVRAADRAYRKAYEVAAQEALERARNAKK